MNPFIDMDVESLFTTYGEKYTHEIQVKKNTNINIFLLFLLI